MRNLNERFKVSNAEILAFSYACKFHRPMCYRCRLLINKFNARGYVLERRFTKFGEITQSKAHYAVQGHSRSPILVPIEGSYTTSY